VVARVKAIVAFVPLPGDPVDYCIFPLLHDFSLLIKSALMAFYAIMGLIPIQI